MHRASRAWTRLQRLFESIELVRVRGPWRGIEPMEFATLEWVD